MTWKKVKIKDIFNFEKWPLQSSKNTPWKYDFITASSERKTHDTFSHEWEHLIFAMAASGSLWRTHYVNWKFISSDLCFILTPKDRNSINMKFYHIYFNLIRKDIVSKTATWSAKIAINQNNFWNYEIIVWDIKEQDRIFDKINSLAPNIEKLLNIFEDQDLVKRLRQSILQDAIQGKLFPQDPNDEPASELLKKIQQEKDLLIKEKKIKKGKDLAPISEAEIPFNLPKGWEWVRLWEIIDMIYWSWLKKEDTIDDGKYPVFWSNGISWYYNQYLTNKRAIIIWRKWSAGALNISELPSRTTDVAYYIEEQLYINFNFMYYLLKSLKLEDLSKWIKPWLNRNDAYNLILWLPPLAEQHRIVAKVDELMSLCDQLQEQIDSAKEQWDLLMESVLSEVFR